MILLSTVSYTSKESTEPSGLPYTNRSLLPVAGHREREITEGERMPPAVDIAAVIKVNENTIIRALHILRHEGPLGFLRGRGESLAQLPEVIYSRERTHS
jgi:Bacterial regulatory proteins, gntR family